MKKSILLYTAIFSLILTCSLSGCKSKQKTTTNNEVGIILEDLPCQNEGRSDKNYYRTSSMATSSDIQVAKEKAFLNAKHSLITLISSNMSSVTDNYINERKIGNATEIEQKFESLTREIANETLNNVSIICEKVSALDARKYRAFIAIEVAKKNILSSIDTKLSNDKMLQVDYDKQRFEEIFNQEMEKLNEE